MGVLYCNIDDYNTCQLNVERLEYGNQYTVAVSPVEQWVGKVKSAPFNGRTALVFELSGDVPIWYGISAGNDPLIQEQIESLANSSTIVNLWGDLLVGVDDVNGTRITVRRMDPPGPGALPSSAACDTGYMGVLEETIDLITYNLEIGNYYPLSYTIGNPFVIGYWRSEGVTLPRQEAYQQLTENYLPSPDEAVIIMDHLHFTPVIYWECEVNSFKFEGKLETKYHSFKVDRRAALMQVVEAMSKAIAERITGQLILDIAKDLP